MELQLGWCSGCCKSVGFSKMEPGLCPFLLKKNDGFDLLDSTREETKIQITDDMFNDYF
jgi:hypothetical protein